VTKQITQAEIEFIKDRYLERRTAIVEPNIDEDVQTIIQSRRIDPTKVKISRRRLCNPVPQSSRMYASTCAYCGCDVYRKDSIEGMDKPRAVRTHDHLMPKCDGGLEVVTACAYCNGVRGHEPLEVFLAFMETSPAYEGRERAFRLFKRDLMLEALDARSAESPKGFDFVAHPRGRYTLKDLRKDKSGA
jgi:hypothetical protein